jgi:hypothetical protein
MATVNFSVPDEVKAAFDAAFGEENKSAVIADLMRRAVRDRALQGRRQVLFAKLSARGAQRPRVSTRQILETRRRGRS